MSNEETLHCCTLTA